MTTAVSTLAYREKMAPPTPEEAMMVRKAQVLIHYAIDRWLGQLAREGLAESTRRKYRSVLDPFGDTVRHKTTAEIVRDDVDAYIDRWANHSKSTLALYVTVLRRFFAALEDDGLVARSPADHLKRPRRKRPEDLDVVTITPEEAGRMLAACKDWQERLCIAVLTYTGVRRQAAARVRRRDVNLEAGTIRFVEKGGKVIVKPLADELLALLRYADRELGQWVNGEAWLIPNRKPWLVQSKDKRGDKVIYETVIRVADRAGIRSHVHAFRGAFAVAFDEANPDKNLVLKDLLGHARMDTTEVYLRRRNKAVGMEAVRSLSFGFPASGAMPPAGVEPAFPPHEALVQDAAVASGSTVADSLLDEARKQAESEKSSRRVDAKAAE